MIKISVIVPIYNAEKYLSQCLKSIVSQSLEDIEILCINDGSIDDSEKILRDYEAQYPQIRLFNQENQGVSVARNSGIEHATGEFVAFVDSDDYYPDAEVLTDLYVAAKAHHVRVCGGSFSEDHGTWIRKEFLGIYTKYVFEKEGLIKYKDYQFDYAYYRFIYDRDMLLKNQIYFPSYIRFQDPPFFVKAMSIAEEFYALKRITYCYRWGHQDLDWTPQRIMAVINGIIDNLALSNQYQLRELHRLTVDRLLREYRDKIVRNLTSENREIIERLLYAETLIHQEYFAESEESSVVILLLAQYQSYEENAKKKEQECQKWKEKFSQLKTSDTYKIGRIFLYLPRKIRGIIKKLISKN